MLMLRRVVGESMLPALRPGAIVVGWRFKRPTAGSIVIARHQGKEIIKRVAQQRSDSYYLLGDNQPRSTDSRTYGWLNRRAIRAVVIKSFEF